MTTRPGYIVLRFLAAPMDVGYAERMPAEKVHGGKVLEWIDKAGYACAVGWSGSYCVTAYVGDVRFSRPVLVGHLVEVSAQIIHTGRSSMHVLVTVGSADPKSQDFEQATQCLVIFVAVGGDGRPRAVPSWQPETAAQRDLQVRAGHLTQVRTDIESAMAEQSYTRASTAPVTTLRFLAAPTDVNWGGKVHGGTVMRWIDEAAYVTGTRWAGGPCIAAYAGGIRFYRPLLIGSVVEVEARLLYTGRSSMHISVHVRSGDPKTDERALTTHSLIIFVALGEQGRSALVPAWEPETPGDQALERHARHLVELRKRLAAS